MAGYQAVAQRNLACAIRIRERRRELGLTQAEVVNRVSQHGSRLSSQALSAIENGRRLAVGRLPDLADALRCTVTYLLGLTDDPGSWQPAPPSQQAPSKKPPRNKHRRGRAARPQLTRSARLAAAGFSAPTCPTSRRSSGAGPAEQQAPRPR